MSGITNSTSHVNQDGQAGRQGQRVVWIDALRVCACFGVIALHVWAPVTHMYQSSLRLWWAGNVAVSLVAWCVPVFVMISGALLLGQENQGNVYRFISRRAHIFWKTAVWSLFYIALRMFTEPGFDARHAAASLKYGIPYYHMWFLYMIMGLYVCTPLLRRFVRSFQRGWRVSVALVLMFGSTAWSFLYDIHYFKSPLTSFSMFLPFLGYYLVGYELVKAGAERRRAVRFLLIFVAAAFCLVLLAFLVAGKRITGIPLGWLYSSYSPLVAVMSMSLFRFFHALGSGSPGDGPAHPRTDRLMGAVAVLSALTLGIYVVHPLFVRVLTHLGLIDIQTWGITGQVVSLVVVLGWSILTAFAISNIPYARALVISRR